jgi:hypothetical protein
MRRTLILILATLAALVAVAAPAGALERGHPEHRREHLRLRCAWVTEGAEQAVACRWSEAKHPQFAEYLLVRADRENGRSIVFRTGDRTVTRHLDTTAEAGTKYRYRVVIVDADGHPLGGSRAVPVRPPVAA